MASKPWSELTLKEKRSIRKAFLRNPQKAYGRYCVPEDNNSSEQTPTPSTPETPVTPDNSDDSGDSEIPVLNPDESETSSGNTVTITVDDTTNSNLNLQAYLSEEANIGELTPVEVSNGVATFSNIENGDYYVILEDADTPELFYAIQYVSVNAADETVEITLRNVTINYFDSSMMNYVEIFDAGNMLTLQKLDGQQSILLADGEYMVQNQTVYISEYMTVIDIGNTD